MGHWARRAIVVGAIALTSLAAWWSSTNPIPMPSSPASANPAEDLKALLTLLRHYVESQPLATLLLPARSILHPGLARTWPEFLRALGPALLLLGLHYIWVIRSAVAFEESSLEQARRRAERLATLRRENSAPPSRAAARSPFPLRPIGPAATAFLWKNLIYASTIFNTRTWVVLGISFGIPALVIGLNARRGEVLDVLPILLIMGLVWSILLGPQLLRHDLRQDLRSAELLKLYPLPGWKIILGELLAPVLTLSVIQLALLLLLAALFTGIPGGNRVELSTRLSMAIGAALVCPALNLVSFLVPNAALLLFPAWLQAGPGGAQGIEATGQRLIALLGQLLVFTLALAPGVAAAVAAYLLATMACPPAIAVPAAGGAAATLLLVESALGIAALGKLFERLDVGTELRA